MDLIRSIASTYYYFFRWQLYEIQIPGGDIMNIIHTWAAYLAALNVRGATESILDIYISEVVQESLTCVFRYSDVECSH